MRLELNGGFWASVAGKGTNRFSVPDVATRQVAFLGTAREESAKPGEGTPVTIALRLKIGNGLISEAELLVITFSADPPFSAENIEKMGSPHRVFSEVIPLSLRPSREETVKAADRCFSGLPPNDRKAVYPCTDDGDRIEGGAQAANVPVKPGE